MRVSPESYDLVIDTYKNPFINLMEIGLVGAVLFHGLNGLRIMAVDFWSKGPRLPAPDAVDDRRGVGDRDGPRGLLHGQALVRSALREQVTRCAK